MRTSSALFLALALGACATPPAAAPARLSDLDWIGGCWESADHRQAERWARPSGGVREGHGFVYREGRVVFREALRLEETAAGVDYVAAPEGQAPVRFALSEWGEGWAQFENSAHDDPKVIRYERDGERLRAWIGADGASLRLALDVRLSGCD